MNESYSSLNQASNKAPVNVFEEYQSAEARFHQACNHLQKSQAERNDAEKCLQEAVQHLSTHIQHGIQDPTLPQAGAMPAQPGVPGFNGGLR